MSKVNFQKSMMILAETYNQKLTASKLEALTLLVGKAFGYDYNWSEIVTKISLHEKYFPNIAEIKKYLPKNLELESPVTMAAACVDRFIAYLSGAIEREDLSEHDLSYCRRKFNVDRFSFARGAVNLDFRRKEWIEMVASDFENGYANPDESLQVESKEVKNLLEKACTGI